MSICTMLTCADTVLQNTVDRWDADLLQCQYLLVNLVRRVITKHVSPHSQTLRSSVGVAALITVREYSHRTVLPQESKSVPIFRTHCPQTLSFGRASQLLCQNVGHPQDIMRSGILMLVTDSDAQLAPCASQLSGLYQGQE